MAISTRTTSVFLSSALALAMIVLAFVFSSPNRVSIADAESSEEILRAYAEKDTDGDGLNDWQEELYGTDPENAHSIDASMTDREAVESGAVPPRFSSKTEEFAVDEVLEAIPGVDAAPGSMTDDFAREFFEEYLTGASSGTVPSEDDLLAFIERHLEEAEEGALEAYTTSSVTAVADSSEAYVAYAAAVETVFETHAIPGDEKELDYVVALIIENDMTAAPKLSALAKAYGAIARGLGSIEVPRSAASAHLSIRNGLRLREVALLELADFEKDPLRATVGLRRYQEALDSFTLGFKQLKVLFDTNAIVLFPGEPGYETYETAGTLSSLPE